MTRSPSAFFAAILVAIATANIARAQSTGSGATLSATWPDRPIRLIIPFQAGSSSDVIGRIVAQRLAERLGQQIVVDNRVGGGSIVGTDAVAHAAPDGYTLGLANTSTHASAYGLTANLPYDPIRDFTPVAMIGSAPFVVLAAPQLRAKTIAEVIAAAKAKPGSLSYASAGLATMAHLSGALFEKMADVQLVHVPYRGTGQSMFDIMEGRVDLLFGTIAPSLPHVRDGKLRALATTGAKRNATLSDVPTMAEAGLPGYESALWTGIVLPAGSPAAIVERLNREIVAIVQSSEAREALDKQGVEIDPGTPEALAARIRDDVVKWRGIIQSAGISAK
jgi:tripartite-type tricarboxylate transporter receptor subunit TctC